MVLVSMTKYKYAVFILKLVRFMYMHSYWKTVFVLYMEVAVI